MAIITIGTPFNIDLEFKIAEIGKRIVAWAVDITVITVYYYLMMQFVYPMFERSEAVGTAAFYAMIIIPVLLYQLLFELFMNGQTAGKMLLGIKVIDKEGKEPTWGQYITRWLLCIGNLYIYIVPYMILENFLLLFVFLFLYVPDFLCVIISAKSQRIGDFAAGTVVIDKNYKANINETIYLEIEQNDYQPVFPQVMRLTDRDINGIRNLLNIKNQSRDTDRYMIDVAHKIKTVLGIQSDLYPTDFLLQLLQDYNYFTGKEKKN